ncbi:MAG: METTL5 family protein [Halobacteriota archaeon]|nr:METTL5 family protein [Halobacteriota archaeon]
MKKRSLEILLEDVQGFPDPDIALEQYATPATVAAELLHFAFMREDLKRKVYDLGCGTGVLAIGAKLLGASEVIGFDVDKAAIEVAKENAFKMDVDVEFVCCNVNEVEGKTDTVVMNPPFGAQVRENDRKFLRKATEVGTIIYSIHNFGSGDFIKRFISPNVITDSCTIEFPIRRTFNFHRRDTKVINAEMYRIKNVNV